MSQSTNHAESFTEHQRIERERERGFRETQGPQPAKAATWGWAKRYTRKKFSSWRAQPDTRAVTLPLVAQGKGNSVFKSRSREAPRPACFHLFPGPAATEPVQGDFPQFSKLRLQGGCSSQGERRTSPQMQNRRNCRLPGWFLGIHQDEGSMHGNVSPSSALQGRLRSQRARGNLSSTGQVKPPGLSYLVALAPSYIAHTTWQHLFGVFPGWHPDWKLRLGKVDVCCNSPPGSLVHYHAVTCSSC